MEIQLSTRKVKEKKLREISNIKLCLEWEQNKKFKVASLL